jgi:hypothetical protein
MTSASTATITITTTSTASDRTPKSGGPVLGEFLHRVNGAAGRSRRKGGSTRNRWFDAHRLLHHALETGGPAVQDRLKERFFRAYLTEGEPIGDADTLVRLAAEVGLDADQARVVLQGERYTDAVREDESLAQRYGITGVPFSVIADKYGVSDAQPATALRQALDTAWAEANPLTVLASVGPGSGEACVDGSCAI